MNNVIIQGRAARCRPVTESETMYKITIILRDGTKEKIAVAFDWEAQAICREEVKWENTGRVICRSIGFDQIGDFA